MVVTGNFRARAELRKNLRRQFQYSARIFIHKDEPLRPCTIHDISNTGARLVLERDQELPDKFILLLTKNVGARRYCKVVWREKTSVGVEFRQPVVG